MVLISFLTILLIAFQIEPGLQISVSDLLFYKLCIGNSLNYDQFQRFIQKSLGSREEKLIKTRISQWILTQE